MADMIIGNVDKVQGIEQHWHGKTEVDANLNLIKCWLTDWDILKERLFTGDMVETEYCQLVATDNPQILIGAPVHCETYQPISNKAFIETVSSAISDISGAKVASVGSVCGRGRVFVSVKLAELEAFTAAGREHKAYLNFLNSHDQSCAFVVNTSNTCTVCNNTFSANLHSADKGAVRIKLKHTKNVALRLENIPEIVDGFLGAQAIFKAQLDAFQARRIDSRKAQHLFAGFIGGDADSELSTRKVNQINRFTELFHTGKGNQGRDLSDAFNAVTDYYSHESSGGDNVQKQIVSSEYGSGQTAKARAFSLFQSQDEVDSLCAVGEKLLQMV